MAVDKKISYEMQGKEKPARNYLGKQKTVTVPVKWKSSPKAPATELAYITKKEKDLILKADVHGSLKKGPNKGPSGVMSLDSQGDYTRDRSSRGIQRDSSIDPRERDQREQQMKDLLTGNVTKGQTVAKGPRTRQYSNLPEIMRVLDPKTGTYKDRYVGSAYKSYGQPSLFGGLFSRGARGYRGIKGLSAFGTPTFEPTRGPDGTGPLGFYTDDEDFAETRGAVPFGLLGILSAIGDSFNKRFGKKQDMSRFNKLQLVDGELVDDPKNTMILSDAVKNPPMESLALQRFFNNNIITPRAKPTETGVKSLVPDNILAAPVKDLSGNVIDTGAFDNYFDTDTSGIKKGTGIIDSIKNIFKPSAPNPNLMDVDDILQNVPEEALMAKVTKADIARNKMGLLEGQSYNDAKDLGLINPEMTEFEFNELKKGNITKPGTYTV